MNHSEAAAVVVGVDGSPGAARAVAWAAAEADARRAPLRLVFALDPRAESGLHLDDRSGRDFAESVLAQACQRARVGHPRLEVTSDVVHASPAEALVRTTHRGRAAMICLGSGAARPPHPGHRASTATEVLLTAECPVAVVRGFPPSRGWVVAQLEAEPSSYDVLHLAVTEAELRRLPVRLLTHWGGLDPDAAAQLDRRVRRDLDRRRARSTRLDAVVVAAPSLEEFLREHAHRVALFVAPQRYCHDVGTVLHPSARIALELLDCPIVVGVSEADDAGSVRPKMPEDVTR
ncbi:universal stress protein [Mycolicibacterium sp. 050158]|uniref:universal stress protein n=1 Tax=Mycolicibacterium sp. 050158 TaxID=3090602 RepID=UPI00299DE032|nr:universal stress protein [Mycolicibacterium sp. 050158]MDX1890790.1 universal stress protein [Mycolicibacterium sp. 050158]